MTNNDNYYFYYTSQASGIRTHARNPTEITARPRKSSITRAGLVGVNLINHYIGI